MKRKNTRLEGEVALPFRSNEVRITAFATDTQRNVALVGVIALAVLVMVYLYGVISSVMYVAGREELSREVTRMSSEVATLESEYLTRTQGITESFARERGFVAITERSFVERASGVSLRSNR